MEYGPPTKGHNMKPRTVNEMLRAKEKIERGLATPANVWEVRPDHKGGFTRRTIDPKAFRRGHSLLAAMRFPV